MLLNSWRGSPAPGLVISERLSGDPSSLRPHCKRRAVKGAFGMTEILVSDVNLNSVCERLEQQCCVDENQHNLSSQPQTPVLKRHPNTGAKLWGRVRSKLLRQKVSG